MSKKAASSGGDDKPKRGRPPGPARVPMNLTVPPRIRELMEEAAARTRDRTLSTEATIAFEFYLRAQGLLGEDETV